MGMLVVLTADHGFPNVPEFAQSQHLDAQRLDGEKLMVALNAHLKEKFSVDKLVTTWSLPNIYVDDELAGQHGIRRDDLENTAARFVAFAARARAPAGGV